MKAVIFLFPFMMLMTSGCATHSRSLTLGGASGVAIGVGTGATAYPGYRGKGQTRNALIGAGIGLGVGLISSYLLHGHVEKRLEAQRYQQDERLRFGDLPPNPFSPTNYRFKNSGN